MAVLLAITQRAADLGTDPATTLAGLCVPVSDNDAYEHHPPALWVPGVIHGSLQQPQNWKGLGESRHSEYGTQ